MKYRYLAAVASLCCVAAPAYAEDTAPPPDFTVAGSAAIVSDYRFRGVSQSDKELAVQAGATLTHKSGFYVGVWGSNLAGWGTFGGSNLELDLIGGYSTALAGGTIDVGLTWYTYPGGADKTDFAEPYVKYSRTFGPAKLLAGVAYAPPQTALGNFSNTPTSRGQTEDNVYVWGDATIAIPKTRFATRGHIGHSNGNPGLGPNGTSVTPTGEYWDWALGLDYTRGPFTFGVTYTDTDITRAGSAYLLPNFSSTKDGSSIAGPQAVFSVTVAF